MKKYGVVEAYLFGSRAEGRAKRKSDYDFIVKFGGKKSLLDLIGLKLELQKIPRRKVDVLTEKSISPLIRPYISKRVRIL